MKVISLLQPWATLVVLGQKKIETRSWNTKHRGPLLIHASAGRDKAGWELYVDKLFATDFPRWDSLPFGAIIGHANLVDTVRFPDNQLEIEGLSPKEGGFWEYSDQETSYGNFAPGRYGWLLNNVVQFGQPIPAKGQLGLWEFPDIEEVIVLDVNDPAFQDQS